jgi:hypothetical protein
VSGIGRRFFKSFARRSGWTGRQIFAQALQRFAGAQGDFHVIGIRQAIEVRPQQKDPFMANGVNCFMNALGILAGERLPEPLQGAALA